MRGHSTLARYAAPAAFLLAATIAVLLVRSALTNGDEAPTRTAVATTVPTTTEKEPTTGTTTALAANAEFYEIQAGDTLAVVADEHSTTVEQLMVLNPDIDPVALRIGERIRVK
jgi:LysM repeat protein